MFEAFVLVSCLSAFTLAVAVFYGKRIVEARARYFEARDAVDDVVLSFNRQLQRQEEQLETSVRKIDVLSSRGELLDERLNDYKKEVGMVAERLESLSALEKALARIDRLEETVGEVASTKGELLQKIAELESHRFQKESEAKIASAIPIKREKALAPLTETELTVLEFLSTGTDRTAPEIKEHIELSREHTARLMKKLYEKGYLERIATKIPFTYRLKEEMQRILKKPEQNS